MAFAWMLFGSFCLLMPTTSYSLKQQTVMDINLEKKSYLFGKELKNKIDSLDWKGLYEGKRLFKYERAKKQIEFLDCNKCGVPVILHNNNMKCQRVNEEEVHKMKIMIRGMKEMERFKLNALDDNIDKIGKEKQETPTVVEVYVVETEDNIANVRKIFDETLEGLANKKKKMDPENTEGISAIDTEIMEVKIKKEMLIHEMKQKRGTSDGVRIEKQRVCPSWTENLKYEFYRIQLENWSAKNRNDDSTKYYEVLESLKKNEKINGLTDYIANIVCEYFKDEKDPSVAKLIEILDKKYLKTDYEKVMEFIDEYDETKEKHETDPAKFFEKFKSLSKQFKDLRLNENFNFFFLCVMMKRGKESGLFSEAENIMMKNVLIPVDGKMVTDNEKLLVDAENEFKKLKIEGQRFKTENAHFGQARNNNFGRQSRSRFRFVPSSSRPDLWRKTRTDASRNRPDARSQSLGGRRFQPNQNYKNYFNYRDRSSSAYSNTSREASKSIEREEMFKKIMERIDNLEKSIKAKDVGFTEAEEVDTGIVLEKVFYCSDEVKTSMIVDGGCPSTLSGAEILDRY